MHIVRKAIVGALVAGSAVTLPATVPAAASHCTGTVQFVGGAPVFAVTNPVEVVGTFDTRGPGFTPAHCDLGWVTTCRLWVGDTEVPASCPTYYPPDPTVCPSAPPCGVAVRSTVNLSPGLHSVTARLGMKWGCCGFVGGPETVAQGQWYVLKVGAADCEDVAGDICHKVDPRVKVLVDDLLPD
ncbi:MAG TPA: hypothetical protein VNA20_04355 [Frankiaceae bacterium]|nr:hypothetical protein [Frankiaceae bacterium]